MIHDGFGKRRRYRLPVPVALAEVQDKLIDIAEVSVEPIDVETHQLETAVATQRFVSEPPRGCSAPATPVQ